MDKPPQKSTYVPPGSDKQMQITPEQFMQEFIRPKSYLSLLPREGVPDLITKYAYNTVEEVIAAIRADYLNNPANRDFFLNDKDFNERMIEGLLERFGSSMPNFGLSFGQFIVVAAMLNTPASFELISQTASATKHDERLIPTLIKAYAKYISGASLSYQSAISYTQSYISNFPEMLRLIKTSASFSEKTINAFIDHALGSIAQRFKNENNDAIPEIRIAMDVGLDQVYFWLSWLIHGSHERDYDGRDFDHRTMLSRIKNATFRIALCDQWSQLLTQAIEKNEHDKVVFLLKSVYLNSSNLAKTPECYTNKLKGVLGNKLVGYIFSQIDKIDQNNQEYLHYSHHGGPTRTQDFFDVQVWREVVNFLVLDAINNPQATPQNILKWMGVADLDFDLNRIMPPRHELDGVKEALSRGYQGGYYAMNASAIMARYNKALAAQKQAIELLLTVAKSSHMNGAVLKYLLDKAADPNAVDAEGITVLMYAIQNAHFDMANLLLDKENININVCDSNGHNALSFAGLLPESQERNALIKRLKDMGAQEEGVCVVQ